MKRLKYFLLKNKITIMIASIILVCAIAVSIAVYAQITNGGGNSAKKEENIISIEDLKNNFENIFTNEIKISETAKQDINYNEIIHCEYDIQNEEGNYTLNAKIPFFLMKNDVTNKVNQEIYDTFAKTIVNIVKNAKTHTIFNLDYVVYVNNNILSLVIRCKYKDGTNPQRNIIQTYNYDLENNKLVTIDEILNYKGLNKDEVQNKISEEIKTQNAQIKTIKEQGYNVYERNEEDKMYKIENTPNFFLGENNCLYLVYAYGNNNFTSEMDLVIF